MPALASLLSAEGLREALVERFAERSVLAPLDDVAARLDGWVDELAAEAIGGVRAEGVEPDDIEVRRVMVGLRLLGQETSIEVPWRRGEPLASPFAARYEATYGHRPEGRPIEVESIRVVASARAALRDPVAPPARRFEPVAPRTVRAWLDGRWRALPAHERRELGAGAELAGPALVLDRHSTFFIEPGWRVRVHGDGTLVCSAAPVPAAPRRTGPAADVVQVELYTNRFRGLVEEAGRMMERTALSTNVKERLDFSCALLDPEGRLVVNAPHIPVHLGAMGLCVRAVAAAVPMGPGDAVVTNHPAFGGSHLPDVTVITPVFSTDRVTGGEPARLGYLATRAHHAEIGGTRPGSMPPGATTLAEEGVVIAPAKLVEAGAPRFDRIEALLRGGPFPSRAVEENLADLRAALAANRRGVLGLQALAAAAGGEAVLGAMARVRARARGQADAALSGLAGGRHRARERLDDGSPIAVSVELGAGRARFDFAGSAGVHPGNLNATAAIVHSAVMYVLRLLLGPEAGAAPLNDGMLEAVDIVLPRGMLDPDFDGDPARAPAVVGGNVETSQRLVDTLIKALGLAACSQGTMNNVLFGGERFGYYETICGGAGAGEGFDGAAAVHTHMTNTRLTDAELLEHRYPVRLERFEVRRGSGGAGRYRGGDGVRREITFLEPLELSILSQHRGEGPYGMNGGAPGLPGRQELIRANGEREALAAIDGRNVEPGDRLLIETPGGGGWGKAGRI